jgi:hypothetical protein
LTQRRVAKLPMSETHSAEPERILAAGKIQLLAGD